MNQGWEILKGNPAPGSPSDLDQTIRAFSKVSSQADDARGLLLKTSARIDPAVWEGSAANAFRESLELLPDHLARVRLSYADAADALRSYCRTLTSAQERARTLRQAAEEAAAEIARADSRASTAQARVDAARSRKREAEAQRDSLRRQQASSTEPAIHANLGNQVSSADSSVRRAQGDQDHAATERDQQRRIADSAEDRLSRSIAQAKGLFDDVQRAAESAARLIEAAESEAQLPNWLERKVTETKELLVTYGPVLVDTLQLGATLFSIAAAVFPVGAPIFLAASLICGGASLLLNVGVTAASPEGFTTGKLLELGLQALAVASTACGLGVISGVKWAAAAGKGVDFASKAGQVVKGGQEGGVKGALATAGCLVLGKAGEKAGGALLKGAATKLSGDHGVRSAISGFSREIREAGNTGLFSGRIRVDPSLVRQQQCLLTGKTIPPGGLQFGNTARTSPNQMDHNPTSKIIGKTFETAAGKPLDYEIDKMHEAIKERFKATRSDEPELHLPQE